jgi:hypothetical protein
MSLLSMAKLRKIKMLVDTSNVTLDFFNLSKGTKRLKLQLVYFQEQQFSTKCISIKLGYPRTKSMEIMHLCTVESF